MSVRHLAILLASVLVAGCTGSTHCALAQHSVSVMDMAIAVAIIHDAPAVDIAALEAEWQVTALRMHSACDVPDRRA